MNAVKNSGYFPACNAVVMLKTRPGQDALVKTKGFGPGNEKEPKKVTFKLEQGLNFTVNVDSWLCNDDFCKHQKAKKGIFVVFL